jgi:hypothetical protein
MVLTDNDPLKMKEIIPQLAGSYYGLTGPKVLDENGDLSSGLFEIWVAQHVDGEYKAVQIGDYIGATDSIQWST